MTKSDRIEVILPPREEIEEEVSQYLNLRFEIIKAYDFLMENPREPQQVSVENFSQLLAYLQDEEGNPIFDNISNLEKGQSYRLNMGHHIEWDYVKQMDEDYKNIPGIIITYHREGQVYPMKIDGHHRLARRWMDGMEHMQEYVLSPEESLELYPVLKNISD